MLSTEINEKDVVVIYLPDGQEINIKFKKALNPARIKLAVKAPREFMIKKIVNGKDEKLEGQSL